MEAQPRRRIDRAMTTVPDPGAAGSEVRADRGSTSGPAADVTPPESVATALVEALRARGETVAVAESLTGGLVIAELVSVPGASAVVRGGVVAYATPLKHELLGVSSSLLAEHGAVDAEVARQMAAGVRDRLAVHGTPATWGISTTGVAGPEPQDGKTVGTVFIGIARAGLSDSFELHLDGDRSAIREGTVGELLTRLHQVVLRDGRGE